MEILKYPTIKKIDELPSIIGKYSFIYNKYKFDGYSILIKRMNDEVHMKFGDWNSNEIELSNNTDLKQFCGFQLPKIINIMKLTRIEQAQYFFSKNMILIDVQVSLNKFLSPGMIKDVFGKSIDVIKELTEPSIISDKELKKLNNFKPFIIKPSYPEFLEGIGPLYAIVE